jgi:hypothetical protein
MAQFESIKFQPQRPLLRELSADRLNTILQEIRRNKPKGERGITVRQSGDGTYIGLAASLPAVGSREARRIPWDIYVNETEGEGENITYKVKVEPGVVSGLLAENYDAVFNANNNTLYYGILRIRTDGEFLTETNIVISDQQPQEQLPQKFGIQESVDILFGLFINGQNKNLVNGQIKVSAVNVLSVPSDSPTVGRPPFDVYYLLQ